MARESATWRVLQPVMRRAGLDPVRIENAVGLGTPDVNFVEGWLEIKRIAAWPRRPDTVVGVRHFTPQQRGWLLRRHRAGGRAWVMLHVEDGDEWLLLSGLAAAQRLGHLPREGLEGLAALRSTGVPAAEDLHQVLTRP